MNLLTIKAKVATQASAGPSYSDGLNVADVDIASTSCMHQKKASSGSFGLGQRGVEVIDDIESSPLDKIFEKTAVGKYLKSVAVGDVEYAGNMDEYFDSAGSIRIFEDDNLSIKTGDSDSETSEASTSQDNSDIKGSQHVFSNLPKEFSYAVDVKRKRGRKCGKNEGYNCTDCGKSFTSRINVKAHWKCMHGKKESYSCTDCGKIFSQRRNMLAHRKAIHSNGEGVKCSVCGKSFSCSRYLGKHFDRMHQSSK